MNTLVKMYIDHYIIKEKDLYLVLTPEEYETGKYKIDPERLAPTIEDAEFIIEKNQFIMRMFQNHPLKRLLK